MTVGRMGRKVIKHREMRERQRDQWGPRAVDHSSEWRVYGWQPPPRNSGRVGCANDVCQVVQASAPHVGARPPTRCEMSVSATITCVQCGTSYPPDVAFCARDGVALRAPCGDGSLVGTVVAGRYRVERKLGEGGMGEVYLAEHVTMGRPSALKVMSRAMARDPDAVGRFHREAANASRISHPHVAAVYDFGAADDGLLYLAMEYVDGETLAARLRSGPIARAEALEIVRQVAAALDAAHALDIVHRDLKPDNMMLSRARDGRVTVKVVDFGIARSVDGNAQRVTRTGLVVGTPEYMSPEHLAGDPVDGRSDSYALALVAFEMLTGALPFVAETAQEMLLLRLTERPRTLARARPDVAWPAALQHAFDRALARDAAARFACAGEMAAAFTAACESSGSTVGTRVPRRVRARPKHMLVGAVAVSLVAAGLAVLARAGAPGASVAAVQRSRDMTIRSNSTTSNPRTRRADTVATSAASEALAPVVAAPAGAAPAAAAPDTSDAAAAAALARVERAGRAIEQFGGGAGKRGVQRAMRELGRALPLLTTRQDSVRAVFYASEGFLRVGQVARACTTLAFIARDAGPLEQRVASTYAARCANRR